MPGITASAPVTANPRELIIERMLQSDLMQTAMAIAPPTPLRPDESNTAEFPIDDSWYGLDLDANPLAGQPVALTSTVYPDVATTYGSVPYALRRFNIGKHDVVYRKLQDLRAVGIDDQVAMARLFEGVSTSTFYRQVLTAVTTTGNYASGYTYDPGNFTTASTNLALLLEGVEQRFRDAQVDVTQADIVVPIARGVMPYLYNLDQIKAWRSENQPTAQYGNQTVLESFIREYLGARSVRVLPDRFRFRTGGTLASIMTASMAFLIADGGRQRSFLKTITRPEGSPGKIQTPPTTNLLRGMFEVRGEQVVSLKGERWYCDGFYEVNRIDDTAGVYWTSVLS